MNKKNTWLRWIGYSLIALLLLMVANYLKNKIEGNRKQLDGLAVLVAGMAQEQQRARSDAAKLSDSLKRIDDEVKTLDKGIEQLKMSERERLNATLGKFRYASKRKLSPLPSVAHAGGEYKGKGYTNSLEALRENRAKYDYFEIDFSFTEDNHIVCSHGWTRHERDLALGDHQEGAPTLAVFLQNRKKHRWTACTLDEVVKWLRLNDRMRVVTDIKEKNIEALKTIKAKYPDDYRKFIPQIYSIAQYEEVNKLDYERVILTLYATNISDFDLVEWIPGKNIYAVTMWHHRIPYLAGRLNDLGYPIYAHTVNSPDVDQFLRSNYGVQGIYTDSLASADRR